MNAVETTLANYRTANEGERLGLFLFHRDLREAFSQIGQENDEMGSDVQPITVKMPSFWQLLSSLKNALLARIQQQDAPVRNGTDVPKAVALKRS